MAGVCVHDDGAVPWARSCEAGATDTLWYPLRKTYHATWWPPSSTDAWATYMPTITELIARSPTGPDTLVMFKPSAGTSCYLYVWWD